MLKREALRKHTVVYGGSGRLSVDTCHSVTDEEVLGAIGVTPVLSWLDERGFNDIGETVDTVLDTIGAEAVIEWIERQSYIVARPR